MVYSLALRGRTVARRRLGARRAGSGGRRRNRECDEPRRRERASRGAPASEPECRRAFFCASYFDGHFAMTPFGATWNPSRPSVPFSTTSASSANVSGTMPV